MNTLDAVEEIQSHTAFFDNLLTSYQLLVHLKSLGFWATENIKNNRLRKGPLTDKKTTNKQKRDTHSYSFDINKEILIVRWLDNTVVNFGTNYDAVELIYKGTCWKNEL